MASEDEGRARLFWTAGKIHKKTFAGMSLASLHPATEWFDRCDFTDADLRFATLDNRHFRFCSFVRANLQSASMRDATFAGCDFTDADLTNADLTGTTLTFVNTGTANGRTVVTGAALTGATLHGIVTDRVVGWEDTQV